MYVFYYLKLMFSLSLLYRNSWYICALLHNCPDLNNISSISGLAADVLYLYADLVFLSILIGILKNTIRPGKYSFIYSSGLIACSGILKYTHFINIYKCVYYPLYLFFENLYMSILWRINAASSVRRMPAA